MVFIPCCVCSNNFKDVATYNLHMRISHQGCKKYVCQIDNCNRCYSLWGSFSKHLVNFHNVPRHSSAVQQPAVVHDVSNDVSNDVNVEGVELGSFEGTAGDIECVHDKFCELKQMIVQQQDVIVAKLYANPAFPRNLVDKMVNDFSQYLSSPFFDGFRQLVLSSLSSDASPDQKQEIVDLFDLVMYPFEHLSSEHKRFAYFLKSGDFIEPKPYEISRREERNGNVLMVKKVLGQRIPLGLVLKKFFELPYALSDTLEFMRSLEANSDWICNFTQCAIWQRKRAKFNKDDTVIPVNFYYDECEANNPLGAHSDPMGCSYIHVPCLLPDWSSKLENIFLALLFDADNRSVYGNKKCFKPAVTELTSLETEGITVCTEDLGEVKVYFVLGCILGDNKALNGVCGLVEGFTANFYCRVCKCHREKAHTLCVEDSSLLRTPESYKADVDLNDSQQTGIKEMCVFDAIPSFETPTDICVDEFHDVIEGVAHYTMLPVLRHFHKMNSAFLTTLNNRMYCIDLGIDNDNRPPLINVDRLSKDKLKMTGAEMYTFVRIFGVLVKDMVPVDDPFYKLYLLLHDIVSLTHAKGLPKSASEILKTTIQEHHELYMHLTKESLKPKHHFLLHYYRLFLLFGPFGLLSTIRFEAKHRMLKLTCNSCFCRKNLSKTVATKQQLGLCYRSISMSSPRSAMVCGPFTVTNLRDLDEYRSFSLTLPENVFNQPWQKLTKWVDYKGTKYEPRQLLLTGTDDVGLFSFAELKFIVALEDRPLFICSQFDTVGYYSEVRGYEVRRPAIESNWFSIEHGMLLDYNPLCLYLMATGENVVILKYVL